MQKTILDFYFCDEKFLVIKITKRKKKQNKKKGVGWRRKETKCIKTRLPFNNSYIKHPASKSSLVKTELFALIKEADGVCQFHYNSAVYTRSQSSQRKTIKMHYSDSDKHFAYLLMMYLHRTAKSYKMQATVTDTQLTLSMQI